MKSLKLVSFVVLCMTASVAVAGVAAPVDQYGRASKIAGGSIAVTSTTADASRVNGRATPALAGSHTQSVIAAERSADDVNGRA